MSPDFTALLLTSIAFGATVLGFMAWRFGGANMMVFVVMAGLFPAVMDFLSSFIARNYEYPGQSRLWVFSYIFFGWIGVCGTCMLLAEGILARPSEDLLSQPRLLWQVPVAAGIIAVCLDLFIDPVAVVAGYWVWLVPGEVYFGIPLLNFVGWFVLMFLAPLAWILIARKPAWGYWRKVGTAIGALVPLCVAATGLSLVLNGAFSAAGLR
jgi:carotenoid biosynthesis protein